MEKRRIICDTDIIIDYLDSFQARHSVVKRQIETLIGLDMVTISAITKMELIAGVKNREGLLKLNRNINWFDVLLINPAINLIAVQLIENYKLSHGLTLADSLIAATAIHTDYELYTFNIRDFKFIPGLKLYAQK